MAIITCPDCGHHPVSDRAPTCPKCGCPIAAPIMEAQVVGTTHVSNPVSSGDHAIAVLKSIVKEAQTSFLTPSQAKGVAIRISEEKRRCFPDPESFIRASIASGSLILGDEDVSVISRLSDEQKATVKSFVALSCAQLDNALAAHLKGFKDLELLDVSYCNGLSSDGFADCKFPSTVASLDLLEVCYLRSCRRLDSPGINIAFRQARNISEVYLDGNAQLNIGATFFVKHCPSLRVLSVSNCTLGDPAMLNTVRGYNPQLKIIL